MAAYGLWAPCLTAARAVTCETRIGLGGFQVLSICFVGDGDVQGAHGVSFDGAECALVGFLHAFCTLFVDYA
eukprot:3039042-Alexandrium_andersonii.AAC.1